MCTGSAVERLQRELQAVVLALEVGDWNTVLTSDPSRPAGRALAGPWGFTRQRVVLRIVARSMELQVHGEVNHAWDQLAGAARLLPVAYCRAENPARAVVPPEPPDLTAEVETTLRIARLIWREQTELADLLRRFAPGSLTPRQQLAEACIEQLSWIDDDPYAPGCRDLPDRSRASLCRRGSRLRQFAHPTARSISQSVWRDVGAFPGLYAEALDRLAARPAPAPWCGADGADDIPVRRGRLRAWERARTRRDDLGYWK